MKEANNFEENWRELYESAPCGYLSSLVDGTIIAANRTFLGWTGYRAEELLGVLKLQDLFTVPGKIFYETHFAPLLQMQGFVRGIALDLVCKHRSTLPVLVTSTMQNAGATHSPFIRSMFFDATDRRLYEKELLKAQRNLEELVHARTKELETEISERKAAEKSLKELTSRLLRLQDEERRRIARDLHDSVGQLLSGTVMTIDSATRKASDSAPKVVESLCEAKELVQEALKEIRLVSYLLHPPLLDESGLGSAIKWYLDGFSARADISTRLVISEDFGRLPQNLEIAIFRVVQECLTNVHRHSGSKSAVVSLFRNNDSIRVEITDHGTGMSVAPKQGVGLRGMQERIGDFGGKLYVQSDASGTTISATIPWMDSAFNDQHSDG